jgi:hypothetical protein
VQLLRNLSVTRYITPLREGGSLPAIVEASDGEKYVLKFKGAGQGSKALIAEFIGSELARKLGFLVPEIVFADLSEGFGRTEPDEEIQDLLKESVGLNLGMTYLQGAITYDPAVHTPNELIASMIIWLDMYITNVDRTHRNTNMLLHKGDLWLIDHGASLYFHHQSYLWQDHVHKPFPMIKNHVFLNHSSKIHEADEIIKSELTETIISSIVAQIPDEWLISRDSDLSPEVKKEAYTAYLSHRLKASESFITEIKNLR